MRKAFFPIFAMALVVSVVVGGLELFVRISIDDGMQYDLEMWKYAANAKRVSANPRIGHEHIPDAYVHAMGADIAINSKGLRDREFSHEREPGTKRILMLGDSLTFGWGVEQDQTPSKQLENALRMRGRNVEVINTGIGNANTVMQVEYFLTEGYRYAPDLVVLNYFINDAEPVPTYDDIGFIRRHSFAYTYLKGRLDVLKRMTSDERIDWKAYYHNLYGNDGNWHEAAKAIDQLAIFCREKGIALAIVNYPELRELTPYPFVDVTHRLKAVADKNNLAFLDLFDSVQNEPASSLWVTRPDPHPNAKADALFGRAMADWLDDQF